MQYLGEVLAIFWYIEPIPKSTLEAQANRAAVSYNLLAT